MKPSSECDSSNEDGIKIQQKRILEKWHEKESLKQIADETGEPVDKVYRTLAIIQKELTERIGVYGRRKTR